MRELYDLYKCRPATVYSQPCGSKYRMAKVRRSMIRTVAGMMGQTHTGLSFDPESHSYALDSQPIPSVTRVLSDIGLVGSPYWTEAHALRGTKLHALCKSLCDLWMDGGEWDGTCEYEELTGYGKALAEFRSKFGLRPIRSEFQVCNTVLKYAGTIDLHATSFGLGGEVIIDYKRTVDPVTTPIQLAAYVMCNPTERTPRRIGLQLHSDGGYDVHDFTNTRHDQEWVSCLNVWRLMERKGKVKA